MKKYDFYWMTNKEWYHQLENGVCVINDNAPIEAQESYRHYLEQTQASAQE